MGAAAERRATLTKVEDTRCFDGPAQGELLAAAEARWPELEARLERGGFN